MALSNLRIVMVETSHPGNIGAAARAMKNMGVEDLALVQPKIFPSDQAVARASGAASVLDNARVCATLEQAIADCQIVVGASARGRTVAWPILTPRSCAETLWPQAGANRVAILFGREHSGLTNEELDLCQYLLHIPCNPTFSSLNVAAAVQVVVYEWFLAAQAGGAALAPDSLGAAAGPGHRPDHAQNPLSSLDLDDSALADGAEMESFFGHLQQTLFDIGFFHATKSSPSLMRRLRRIFHRARLEKTEIHMLRGILRQMQIRSRQLEPKG